MVTILASAQFSELSELLACIVGVVAAETFESPLI